MSETAAASPHIKLLLVEDHGLMRRGLVGQFRLEEDFEVVGEAENGQQAVNLAVELQPTMVLMDIELPVLDGVSATQQIKSQYPDIRVLALSAFGAPRKIGINGLIVRS